MGVLLRSDNLGDTETHSLQRSMETEAVWMEAFHSPVIQKEPVLDEEIQDKVDQTLHSHTDQVLPHKVPPERVYKVFLSFTE